MSDVDEEPIPDLVDDAADDSSDDDEDEQDAPAPLLASVAQLATSAGLTIAADDPRATAKLRGASGKVRDYLRQFVSRVVDDVVELEALGWEDGRILYILPELPVRPGAVSSVKFWGSDSTWTDAPAGSWRLKKDGILHAAPGYAANWQPGREPIQVTYTHGWTNIPDSILDAVLGVAERSYLTPAQLESKRLGERSEKYLVFDGGFSPLELVGLDRYRQLV